MAQQVLALQIDHDRQGQTQTVQLVSRCQYRTAGLGGDHSGQQIQDVESR